jgi:hypothetical protein
VNTGEEAHFESGAIHEPLRVDDMLPRHHTKLREGRDFPDEASDARGSMGLHIGKALEIINGGGDRDVRGCAIHNCGNIEISESRVFFI